MSDELQKELAAWLASMRDSAQGAANLAIEQAPLIVQEKLLYGRITYTLAAVLCLGVAAGALAVVFSHIRTVKAREGDGFEFTDTEPGVLVPFGMVGLFATVFGVGTLADAFKVWFAPRLYIVEWLASLVK